MSLFSRNSESSDLMYPTRVWQEQAQYTIHFETLTIATHSRLAL
jgi:hypothetical protein